MWYPILNLVGSVLFVFLVFPKVFRKPTKPSGKPTIPNKTNKTFGKTKKQSFSRFQTHPWICFFFFCFCWFSRRFLANQKTPSGKPTIQKTTKENKHNIRENQKNKVFKGFIPTLRYVSFFGFPEGFYKKNLTHIQEWVWNL